MPGPVLGSREFNYDQEREAPALMKLPFKWEKKTIKWINDILCVSQGGIGEKGAEGTAGNDGARVSEIIPFPS